MPKGCPKKIKGTELDLAQIEAFGTVGATHQEMADYFGVNVRTIERYMADENSDICRVYKGALSKAKLSFRRTQMALAQQGNATMAIWLGKTFLGQRDVTEVKQDIDLKHQITGFEVVFENPSKTGK